MVPVVRLSSWAIMSSHRRAGPVPPVAAQALAARQATAIAAPRGRRRRDATAGFATSAPQAGLGSPPTMSTTPGDPEGNSLPRRWCAPGSALGIGVVGASSWGRNVVRTFAAAAGASLRAVCDLRPELLARVSAAHPGVRVTPSFDDLLADVNVAAVAVAVDGANHHRLARRALEAGRHVLVEKPLALTVADSEELCVMAERARRVLM